MSRLWLDRSARLAAACLLLLGSVTLARGQEPASALGDNAALKYWQAFAQLPQWTEQQNRIIGDWNTVPLDGDAQAVVDSARAALQYLQRGASLPECNWGLDLSDGPGLLMPHLGKARELARLAALRARRELARGHQSAAMADINAGLALARNVGVDNILISVLVQSAIQNTFVDVASAHLMDLEPASLEALTKELASLPPGGTVKGSMSVEQKYFLDWFRQHLQAEGPSVADQFPEMKAVLDEVGSAAATVLLLQFGKFYDEAARVADLPPSEQKAGLEALERKYSINPVAKLLTPAYGRSLDAENKAKVRLAMLRAAIAVRQGGREHLADVPDPYGDGPFTYRERPRGFELVSKLVVDSQPVTLVVGPRDAEDDKQ